MSRRRVVVVGHGMVAHRFVERLSELEVDDLEVVVLGEESRPAYDRVHLTSAFDGKSAEDLAMPAHSGERVRVLCGARAVAVDRGAQTVIDANNDLAVDSVSTIELGSASAVSGFPLIRSKLNIFRKSSLADRPTLSNLVSPTVSRLPSPQLVMTTCFTWLDLFVMASFRRYGIACCVRMPSWNSWFIFTWYSRSKFL